MTTIKKLLAYTVPQNNLWMEAVMEIIIWKVREFVFLNGYRRYIFWGFDPLYDVHRHQL